MSMKYALITGASGLLGSATDSLLRSLGYTTIGLQHNRPLPTNHAISGFNELKNITTRLELIINLSGAPIANYPWTRGRKQQLISSRIDLTRALVHQLVADNIQCKHFISGSAIGYYGTGHQSCSEDTSAGEDFSAQLCQQWEAAALKASNIAERISLLRTGLVLAPKGGFLAPLTLPTKAGVGMIFGQGDQILSWIDHRDWLSALAFIIDHRLTGPINMTAPTPVTQREFMSTLATTLNRRIRLRVPALFLTPMGEMKTLLLEGQSVLPTTLDQNKFAFKYPTLKLSLETMW